MELIQLQVLLLVVGISSAQWPYPYLTNEDNSQSSTTQSTMETTTEHFDPEVWCLTCEGSECLSSPQYTLCPGGFCMKSGYHYSNGTDYETKSCATREQCKQEWWIQTSGRLACMRTLAPPNTYLTYRPMTCHFCCRSDHCNDQMPFDELYYDFM